MESFALVRADDPEKVKIALHDLERYGNIWFSAAPKSIEASYADEILVRVMGVPLRSKCKCAALAGLNNQPGVTINRLRSIHPPAHIIIIGSDHGIFKELINKFQDCPELVRISNQKMYDITDSVLNKGVNRTRSENE